MPYGSVVLFQLMEGFTMKYLLTKLSGVVLGVSVLFAANVMAQAPSTESPKVIVESVEGA